MEDLYAILGVPSSASEDQIRAAYREKIRQAHPDVEGGDEEWAKQVTAAYNVLSDPDSRRQYDQTQQAAVCPFCGRDLRRLGDVEAHLYSHYVEQVANGCDICGRQPTQTYSFKSNSGFILARQVWGFEGKLCGVCAEGMFREFQARNITRGPWGVFSFLAAIWYLVTNATGFYSKSRKPPTPSDPVIDSRLRGKSVFARPAVLMSLAIIGFLGFAVFGGMAQSSSSGIDPVANTPGQTETNETTPVVTQPPATFNTPDWEVGSCVSFSGDLVRPVRCSNASVDGHIVDIVSGENMCPIRAEWYVELSFNEVACIEE